MVPRDNGSSERRDDPSLKRDTKRMTQTIVLSSPGARNHSQSTGTHPIVRSTSTDEDAIRPLPTPSDKAEYLPGESNTPFYGHDGEDTATEDV
jgi:hypothetical protein